MTLKKLTICTLVIIINFILPDISLAVAPGLYPGNPEFIKLPKAVVKDILFAKGPHCNIAQTNLMSHSAKTGKYYSHYQMNTVAYQGFKTKYWTRETVATGKSLIPGVAVGQGAIINGKGISYSGIFWPLEVMTARDQQGNLVYYNKIEITSMQPDSGTLFPLKVGNDLKFHFTRLHLREINGESHLYDEKGIMEYKVIKQFRGYPNSKVPVPGNIYTIEVIESTNLHPKPYLTDIYNYAENLGWYITDKYFNTNNQLLAIYRLDSWQAL